MVRGRQSTRLFSDWARDVAAGPFGHCHFAALGRRLAGCRGDVSLYQQALAPHNRARGRWDPPKLLDTLSFQHIRIAATRAWFKTAGQFFANLPSSTMPQLCARVGGVWRPSESSGRMCEICAPASARCAALLPE